MFLTPLLLALNVSTFPTDPSASVGPIAGLRQVWIDPATVATTLRPTSEPPPGEVVANAPGGGLGFTNPTSTWAKLSVNDTPVGEIAPYATARVAGLAPGWYAVSLDLPNGLRRSFAIELP